MTNPEVAALLDRIGQLLDIKGESRFKVLAYQKAAESVRQLGRDLHAVQREGGLADIPGFGAAIAALLARHVPAWSTRFAVVLFSGLIAGEGLAGVAGAEDEEAL